MGQASPYVQLSCTLRSSFVDADDQLLGYVTLRERIQCKPLLGRESHFRAERAIGAWPNESQRNPCWVLRRHAHVDDVAKRDPVLSPAISHDEELARVVDLIRKV